jgi:hypothetical protein
MKAEPRFLLQPDGSGPLYGYWTLELLMLDILLHGEWLESQLKIFELRAACGRVTYEPISISELKKRKENQ